MNATIKARNVGTLNSPKWNVSVSTPGFSIPFNTKRFLTPSQAITYKVEIEDWIYHYNQSPTFDGSPRSEIVTQFVTS